MKKADILKKVEYIQQIVDDRNYTECEDDFDWVYHYDSLLRSIRGITDEILKQGS